MGGREMPFLIRVKYLDKTGKVLENIGPKELYITKVNSLESITSELILNTLEEDIEDYDWSGSSEIFVEWQVITSSVN